jgi:hypothetical protein
MVSTMDTHGTAKEQPLRGRESKDLKVLTLFTEAFCRAHHRESPREVFSPGSSGLNVIGARRPRLCAECREFLAYAISRRLKCPLDPKPACKHCHVHCYRPGHREKVREIMRFSGQHLIRRGRLDLLWHYLF